VLCDERWHALWGADAVGMRLGGSWWWVAYKELQLLVAAFRGGLASLGVGEGDAVAIVAANRLEWIVACHATYGRRASVVPIDPGRSADECRHVLGESGARVAIADGDAVTALRELQSPLPTLRHVVALEPRAGAPTYETLLDAGRRRPVAPIVPGPTDVAELVYRSPRDPRAAVTHGTIDAALEAVRVRLSLAAGDRVVVAAPWARMAARMHLHAMLTSGCAVALPDPATPLPTGLAGIEPSVVFSTPEQLGRLAELVDVSALPHALRPLLCRGMRAAARRRHGASLGPVERLFAALAERMLPDAVRMPLGGRVRSIISNGPLGRSADVVQALAEDVRQLSDGDGSQTTSGVDVPVG